MFSCRAERNGRAFPLPTSSCSSLGESPPYVSVVSDTLPPPHTARIDKSSTAAAKVPISSVGGQSELHDDTPPPIDAVPHSRVSRTDSNKRYSDTAVATLAVPIDNSYDTSEVSLRFEMGPHKAPSTELQPQASVSQASSPKWTRPVSYLVHSTITSPVERPWLQHA